MKIAVLNIKALILTLALAMVAYHAWAKIPSDLESRFNEAVKLADDGKAAKAEKLAISQGAGAV
jgi:hypothetical protein